MSSPFPAGEDVERSSPVPAVWIGRATAPYVSPIRTWPHSTNGPPTSSSEREHVPENNISRRTLAKSAAWSVPVVAVAVAAPMAAASNTTDYIVSRNCALLGVLGSLPTFTLSASTGTIPVGTVLTLTAPAVANVNLTTSGLSAGVLTGTTRTFTVTTAATTVSVAFTGINTAFLLQNFTFALVSLPTGSVDTNLGNNIATANVSGTSRSPLPGFTGVCL